jgi:hypothetical protein
MRNVKGNFAMNLKLEVGQQVTRMLGGMIPMQLKVTDITDDKIICGAWQFCINSGVEIDEDMDSPASYIILP